MLLGPRVMEEACGEGDRRGERKDGGVARQVRIVVLGRPLNLVVVVPHYILGHKWGTEGGNVALVLQIRQLRILRQCSQWLVLVRV